MLETSSSLQSIVLTSLINDSSLFGSVIEDLSPNFFEGSNQFIYKVIRGYYVKYKKAPSLKDTIFLLTHNHKEGFGDLQKIIHDARELFNTEPSNAPFVKDAIETFVKRAKIENLFSEVAQKFDSDKSFTIDDVMQDFITAYNYQITDIETTRLDDFDRYLKLKDDLFGSIDNNKIIKSFIPTINSKLTFGGFKPTDLITVVAAPGVGKTTFLINQGLSSALQGHNVLHIYLGDMNEVTAANRYMACLTGLPINTFLDTSNYKRFLDNDANFTVMNLGKRIHNIEFPIGSMSADKLRAVVLKLQEKHEIHFDLIIVDYADNLAQEKDSMYENGGMLYGKLKALASENKSVIITASQPQRTYYNSEVIPFEGVAESTKKLHIVDVSMTLGKPSRGANIATLHLAKVREGVTGDLIRLNLEANISRISEISEEVYSARKSEIYEDPTQKAVRNASKDE
jgi:replicative DNA helicase